MVDDIFPSSHGEIEHAVEAIANFMDCPAHVVSAMLFHSGLVWDTPNHLKTVREVTHAFNDAARYAGLLHRALTRLTEAQRKELIVAGCVTTFQVEHLKDVLAQDAENLSSWSRDRLRAGGRNLAAYHVAEFVRRVFRRLRRAITYGVAAGSDAPSTAFGRAVEFALGAFGIRAGWRGPAHDAWSKQQGIIGRHAQMYGRCQHAPNQVSVPPEVVVSRVRGEHRDCFVLTVLGRPDIPPHEVCASTFASGAEVAAFADKWLNSLNAK